jgi:hypothetical protein
MVEQQRSRNTTSRGAKEIKEDKEVPRRDTNIKAGRWTMGPCRTRGIGNRYKRKLRALPFHPLNPSFKGGKGRGHKGGKGGY